MSQSEPPFFILFSDQGAVIALPMDKHVFFGRAEGNTITIDDARVSRQHAELWWDGESFILSDLNSSNGTTVNEQDIAFQPLNNQDVICIGGRHFTYRIYHDKESLRDDVRALRRRNSQQETRQMNAVQNTLPDTDFNGTLASIPMTDLCQLLALCHRTGVLQIQGSRGKGEMYFHNGEVVCALLGELAGDDALVMILREGKGFFSFKENVAAKVTNVAGDLMFYLLEIARTKDESGHNDDGSPTVHIPH